jgi:ketosteroid isomerase-like protein
MGASAAPPARVPLKPRELSIALLDEIHDAFNTRDADQIMAYFHPETTFYPALGPEPVGRTVRGWDAVHKFLADRFKVIPDMHWETVDRYVCDANRAVTVWMVTGKAADGTVLNYKGCDLWEFRDGLVFNKDTFWKIVQK